MTKLLYSITTTLVLELLLMSVPANPLPTSSPQSSEGSENYVSSPRISAVQGYSFLGVQSKDETGYKNSPQKIPYTSIPPSFGSLNQYENAVSSGRSANEKQLLYPSPHLADQSYLSVPHRSKSSLMFTGANDLTQRNMELLQQNQRILRQHGYRRGGYVYPRMYPNQFPYSNTPVPIVIPLPINNAQSYPPQYTNRYPNSDADQNDFIPQNNEQSPTTSNQTTQQPRPPQNTNNAPSQNQGEHNSNASQNSVQNQPGNQNISQQPNADQNGIPNPTGNGNQNQNGYPYSGMQYGGGQNPYSGGIHPNQNTNLFPNGIPIQYAGPGYNVLIGYPNPFQYGYQAPYQNVQYRPIST